MSELQAGVYKHYKGGLYLLLGIAEHTETHERLVVYVPLSVRAGAKMQARPYGMFVGHVEIRGMIVPRFMYIGEEVDPAVARWYDPLSGYRGADRVDS